MKPKVWLSRQPHIWALACWLLVCLVSTGNAQEPPLIWASAGGGWRAMTSTMGYAQAFSEAGLINSTACAFQSISTNSGASWFSTQYFFSPVFFDKITNGDPQELYDFILEWMNAYRKNFWRRPFSATSSGDISDDDDDVLSASLFFAHHREWSVPRFFNRMLERTSSNYGDSGFVKRPATPQNRVVALQNTSMCLQSGLSPVSRVRSKVVAGKYSYLGLPDSILYRVLLPFQFAVEESKSSFKIGTEPENLPVRIYTSRAKRTFRFKHWEKYYLYNGPDTKGSILSKESSNHIKNSNAELSEPFGGQPSTSQVALMGSVFTSTLDGLSPATFAQNRSLRRYTIETSGAWFGKRVRQRLQLLAVNSFLYKAADRVGNLGMCTQWPKDCGTRDAQLTDGGFADGPSLAMHVARYSGSPRIKAILTVHNFESDSSVRFLMYFNTTFNQGVDPGGFLWGPPIVADGIAQPYPMRSVQIFEDYLDESTLSDALTPITDVSVSSARFTLTTVDNPALGVVAGQQVELLLFSLVDSPIPTLILGKRQVDQWKGPLAENARNIAESAGVKDLVRAFANS